MVSARAEYRINPRFVPDDIPVWFGNGKDAAVTYDATAKEWTVQTTNAAGTLVDRLAVGGESNTPSVVFNDPGNDVDVRMEAQTKAYAFFLEGSTGKLLLGGNTVLSPDTKVHIWEGSAGLVSANGAAQLTIENSQGNAIQLLTPNNATQSIYFGDPESAVRGGLGYDHNADLFRVRTQDGWRLHYTSGAFAFQEATTISTPAAADLSLKAGAAGNVNLGDDVNLLQVNGGGFVALLSCFMELDEIAEPSAPGANKARLFVQDNGSNKSQLAVRFSSGASQVLATEP